ncbi:MAG: hypothetical protein HY704_14630 [Gemmatimonadetes bacterium]|nr:hypothetical protein [Gemmatimonadota bacterium]
MNLMRLRLRPVSPWRTPWQADTVSGLLCWMCARVEGPERLRDEVIDPMLAGEPPFVFSDAFPGDLLPVPVAVKAGTYAPEELRVVKRARWLTPASFERVRCGECLGVAELVYDDLIVPAVQTRNTLGRLTDTTGGPGALFTLPELVLDPSAAVLEGANHLSIYVRVARAFAERLLELLDALSQHGFGADASVGKGQFTFPEGYPVLEPVAALDAPLPGTDAVISLSTFQPGPADPVDGYWEAFVKSGKLGPDLGLADVRKNPLIMLRPGACFRSDTTRRVLGRAIPASQLLPAQARSELSRRDVTVIHPAFGLGVPARLDWRAAL